MARKVTLRETIDALARDVNGLNQMLMAQAALVMELNQRLTEITRNMLESQTDMAQLVREMCRNELKISRARQRNSRRG